MQGVLGDSSRVIRTMPNTPAMIGEGMTVWSQSSEVTEEQHDLVRSGRLRCSRSLSFTL